MLIYVLHFLSFALVQSSPINQGSIDTFSQLDARAVNPIETPNLIAPTAVSDRPSTPYLWPVPWEEDMYVNSSITEQQSQKQMAIYSCMLQLNFYS